MLIPLIFKNNDTDQTKTKIGKITPALERAMRSYSFANKTGNKFLNMLSLICVGQI